MLDGDFISAAARGTNENPVITPLALRLTSAVTCCHHGLPRECISSPHSELRWALDTGRACRDVIWVRLPVLNWIDASGWPGLAGRLGSSLPRTARRRPEPPWARRPPPTSCRYRPRGRPDLPGSSRGRRKGWGSPCAR